MIRKSKRIGALLLALVMIFSMFPASAFATSETSEPKAAESQQSEVKEDASSDNVTDLPADAAEERKAS